MVFGMECVISSPNVHVLGKSIHCLAKIGDEIVMEIRDTGVLYKSVNAARSVYAMFQFNKGFFDSFEICGSSSKENVSCYKIMTKSLLLIFRGLSSLEKTVNYCFMSVDSKSHQLTVTFHCKHGIIKRHKIGQTHCETLQAMYSKKCSNHLMGAARTLTEVVVNFPNSVDEVTLITKINKVVLKNYTEDFDDSRNLSTEVCMMSNEFDICEIKVETSITFCLKEFKAILFFTDSIDENITINFETCGKPVVLTIDHNPDYTVDVVLASLTETEEENYHKCNSSMIDGIDRYNYEDKVNCNRQRNTLLDRDRYSCSKNTVMESHLLGEENQLYERLTVTDTDTIANKHETLEIHVTQDVNVIVPSSPPYAKKFKSMFSLEDMFGEQEVTDSILAIDSEKEDSDH